MNLIQSLRSNSIIIGLLAIGIFAPEYRVYAIPVLATLLIYKIRLHRRGQKLSYNQVFDYINVTEASHKMKIAFWLIIGALVIASVALVFYPG